MKHLSPLLQIIAILWLGTSWSFAGFILNPYRFASGSDPYFADVSLLLHCDGTEGGTTFIDSSSAARPSAVRTGSPALTISQKKFGTGSINFPTGLDGVSFADDASLELGSGDFTLELWLRCTNSASRSVFHKWNSAGDLSWYLGAGAGGYGFVISTNGSNVALILPLSTWPSLHTWFHLAVCRSGSSWRLFVDGVQQGSTYTSTATIYDGNQPVVLGDDDNNPGFVGQMDDVRITVGVARYTADFTPPTAAFPDS